MTSIGWYIVYFSDVLRKELLSYKNGQNFYSSEMIHECFHKECNKYKKKMKHPRYIHTGK